jgi:hypothetical protein
MRWQEEGLEGEKRFAGDHAGRLPDRDSMKRAATQCRALANVFADIRHRAAICSAGPRLNRLGAASASR